MPGEAERQAAKAAVQAWDMEHGSLLLPDEHAVIANRAIEAAELVREADKGRELVREADKGRKREMKLPDGRTCEDCVHAQRCFAFGFSRPGNSSCDFSPNRFRARGGRRNEG